MQTPDTYVDKMLDLGRQVRDAVIAARQREESLAGVSRGSVADTIYHVDSHTEPVLEAFFSKWGESEPIVVIAEGIIGEDGTDGKAVFPRRTHGVPTPESAAGIRLIMDPIDGTRAIMYDKRSAWVLIGIAPNKGEATRLSDIFAAVQVEIPTSKQTRVDLLWAIKGRGAHARREDLHGGAALPLAIRPSQADNIHHAFATVTDFFPATKELAGRLMEEIAVACLGELDVTRATVFEDQYITTGGQFYELMMGHDRFIADLRPTFYKIRGLKPGLCVHPYDVSALLIAREAGIEITDGLGGELDGPLDVETGLQWAGFANKALRARIEPVMLRLLGDWLNTGGPNTYR